MVREREIYLCEVCGSEWFSRELAEKCEALGIPKQSARWEIGGEVKLKNRSEGYTLAIVKGARIALFSGVAHAWKLHLDRGVYLDQHWEESTNEVFDLYVLTEELARGMKRKDNFGT